MSLIAPSRTSRWSNRRGGAPAAHPHPTRTYATPRATTPSKRPPPPDPEPVPTPPPPPPRPPVHPFDAERARVVAEADARARRSAAQDADDTARANAEAKQFFDAALEVALDIATSAVEASIAEYLNELLGTSAGDKASSDLSHRESAFARWKLEGALLGLRSKEAEKAALGSVLDALSQIVEKFVGRMRGAVAAPSGSAEDVADFWRRSAYVNKLTGALIRQKQKVMARLAVVEAWTAAPEDIDAFHLWSRAAEFRRTRNDRGDWYAARSAITVLGLGFRDLALGAIHASTFGVFDLKPALPDSSAFTAGAILGTPIVGVAQAKVLGFLAREVATAARISASVSSRVVGPAMKAFAESVRKATATLGGRLTSTARVHGGEGGTAGLAGVARGKPPTAIYTTIKDDFQKVVESGRVWGQTEGAVYGMAKPDAARWRTMLGELGEDPGRVVFTGRAAEAFHKHEFEGVFSGLKRLLGQHKSGFGDLAWDPKNAVRMGDTLYVSDVQLAMHAGQTEAKALARLWGRRLGADAPLTAWAVYTGYKVIDASGVLSPEGSR